MTLLLLSLAHADIPPPPDYVETCTVAQQCVAGEEGRTCGGSFQGRDECVALEADGWQKRCQTRGASVWTEVLCRSGGTATPAATTPAATTPAATETAAVPAPAEPRRCATSPFAGALGLLAALGFVARRRSG